ncbi:SGNH/GDSL hydrolase family protein [Actinoplanes sp. DH11]|uniref:SGNH/GDSL hydrolase family protein n=1 Tax=Actinoplanes sp. DH11 TaxID=2857011 RepID=UPI001E588390|nr:SGNH/GDSL hydrolase family protein [Actinoplanes sp. DH11]
MLRALLPALAVSAGVLFGVPATAAPVTAATDDTAPVRIMPLGDSITAGVGVVGKDGYRLRLQRKLTNAGMTFDFVGSQQGGTAGDPDHEGHGGWTIDQLTEQAGGWVNTYDPDVVLLHAGTNNITRGEKPAQVAGKLAGLIDQVRAAAPEAQIYVATIVGTAVTSEEAANVGYNRLIPGVVADKGPRVHLVDQAPIGGLSIYDRHHPNAYGYARMAHTWYEALRTTIDPSWPVTPDPDDTDQAYLCHYRTVRDCRWWHRRPVTAVVGGTEVTTVQWQTRRFVTERYRATVPGHYRSVDRRVWVKGHHQVRTVKEGGKLISRTVWVKGHWAKRPVRTWVPARTVTRTRTVSAWVGA